MAKNLPGTKRAVESSPKATTPSRIEELKPGPRFERFYANHAQVQNSFYDFRLHFNQVITATKGKFLLEEQCTVSMSPEHAADLLRALKKSIDGYEKNHGAIRRDPSPESPDAEE